MQVFLSFCSDFHCSRITNKKLILFANNERTNEQLTDFVFTPKLYILYYNSNLFHIFPILYPFLCDKFTIMLYFIELIWLKKYVFKKWVNYSEKSSNLDPKLLNLTNNCSSPFCLWIMNNLFCWRTTNIREQIRSIIPILLN